MAYNPDWYPKSRAEQRIMYQNVDAKIENYKTKYDLSEELRLRVHLICRTFIEGFDKLEQNRATGKQLSEWFENILTGEPAGELAPAPPVFQTITMPAGAFIGLEAEFREFARFFKNNPVYDRADGEDLMIVAPEGDSSDLATVAPEIRLTGLPNNAISVEWVKSQFDALELQYREAGTEAWLLADKSTAKVFEFAPPTGGTPKKIELRAVYLIKNQRVGQWSPIYTLTIG